MRFIVALFCAILCFSAKTQTLRFGPGFNISSIKTSGDDSLYNSLLTKRKAGHLNLNVEFNLGNGFFLESGINYTSKGFKHNGKVGEGRHLKNVIYERKLFYADFPIQLNYKIALGNQANLFFSTGGYFGVLTRTESVASAYNFREIEKLKIGATKDDDFERFDGGLTMGGGLESRILRFGMFYDYGLYDIAPNNFSNFKAINKVLRMSLAFRLASWNVE